MAHFLKHLTEDTITVKKLLVPAEFVTKCGRANLTNPVVLEPTVGDPLEVELYEDGCGFWLRNGWPELADQYSLRHGHYLLFEYRSYSRFKLVMLGANGLDLVSPTPKLAYFLKHVTEDTIRLKKLLIPSTFVMKCGKVNLTNPVVLEPTVGDPLEVELYEDHSGFWLRNGWPEFVDEYRLSHGHYLLFEYKSYSRFKLVMLAANGLDLVCPASSFHNVQSNGNQEFPEVEEEEDSDFVEFLGSSVVKNIDSNGSGGRQPAQPRSTQNAKQKAFMSTRKGRTADGGQRGKMNKEASRRNRGKGSQFGRDKAKTSHIPAMAEHDEGIPDPRRGNASTSSVSPSFFLTISQYHMKYTQAYLPADFVFKHMKLENSTVMVRGEDGSGPWSLSFLFLPAHKCKRGRGQGFFGRDWVAFRRDNALKPGDVCRFKLISSNEMEVTIHRNEVSA